MIENPKDKNGRKIEVGDTLKIFHFTGSRRKKHYMYKYVMDIYCRPNWRDAMMKISHLNTSGTFYYMRLDGQIHPEIEIVQGYSGGVPFECRYRD